MESTQSPVGIVYIINARIFAVSEKFREVNHRKDENGKHAFDHVSKGWFIQFEGSNEALRFGDTKPDWIEGDEVKITFEKVTK